MASWLTSTRVIIRGDANLGLQLKDGRYWLSGQVLQIRRLDHGVPGEGAEKSLKIMPVDIEAVDQVMGASESAID